MLRYLQILFLVCCLVHHIKNEDNQIKKRQKRYLLFTDSTQWGVFATVSIPLHPENTVSMAWFYEANYYNVDNATYFVQPFMEDASTISRDSQQRSYNKNKDFITRSSVYRFFETMLEKHNYPGRPCLLRAICESVTTHFLHNGLLGDIIHLFLTPSTSISEDIEDVYYEAEYYGIENECYHYVDDCPSTPLEFISTLVEGVL